ncbi:MAG: hypothetical protein ABIR94_24120, partial [Rubrivivax sp.]
MSAQQASAQSDDEEAPHIASAPLSGVAGLWGRLVWGDIAHLLLLTMLVVVAHAADWLHVTEGYYRRHAVTTHAAREMDATTIERAPASVHNVQMFEVSAKLRAQLLESKVEAEDKAVQRLGGVRPIDRCKFAELLQELAKKRATLPDLSFTTHVIAIDVDVAPLNAADEAHCSADMERALLALRATARVIAITTPRDDPEEAGARDRFMGKTCEAVADRGALYYASPAVFHERHGYPLDFLHDAKPPPTSPFLDKLLRFLHLVKQPPHDAAAANAAPVFPSLGNMLALAAWPAIRSGADPQRTLTSLCQLAGTTSASANPAFLESLLGARDSGKCESVDAAARRCAPRPTDTYRTAAYNWRLLHPDRLLITPIKRPQPFDCTDVDCVDESVPKSALLMVSIDGGDQQDKFDVPQAAADPVGGAAMHALQALSIGDRDDELELHSGWAVVVDLLVGLAFLVAWKGVALWIATWGSLPSSRFMARLVAPAAIALFLYWV